MLYEVITEIPHIADGDLEMRSFVQGFAQSVITSYSIHYTKLYDYWEFIISWLLLPALLIFIWIMIMRRMSGGGGGSQLFNIGKSKAILFDKDMHVKVTFNDVAGLEEAKVEVMEIVDFLKNPKKYTQLGGKIPRGALLVGPPGTGKIV